MNQGIQKGMRQGMWKRLMAAVVAVGLSACGGGGGDASSDPRDGDGSVGGATVTLSSVGIGSRVVGVNPGQVALNSAGVQLDAIGTFVDAAGTISESIVTNEVAWSVSDPTVATVSNTGDTRGLVRGLRVGNTDVRVEARDTRTGSIRMATLPIQVFAAATGTAVRLVVSGTPPTAPGTRGTYSAFLEFADGTTQPVSANWSTTTPARIGIDPLTGPSTTLTAFSTGGATLLARATVEGRELAAPVAFDIGNAPPTPPPSGGDGRDARETPEIIAECGELGPPTTRFLTVSVNVCPMDRTLILGGAPKTYVANVNYTDLTAGRPDVIWLVEDPSIVEITPSFGNYVTVTPKKVGSTLIRVQTPRSAGSGEIISGVTQVTVASPATPDPGADARVVGALITPDDTTLPVGQSRTFTAFAVFDNGAMRVASPGTVTWSVGNTAIATLDSTQEATTRANLRAVGTTPLSLTLTSGTQRFTETIMLTATPVSDTRELVSLRLDPDALEPIGVSRSRVVVVEGVYSDGSTGSFDLPVRWTSDDVSVVNVNPRVQKVVTLTGRGVGQTVVRVTATEPDGGTLTATLPVTVVENPRLTRIRITPDPVGALSVGQSRVLFIEGFYADNVSRMFTGQARWTSSDPSVVAVGDPGPRTSARGVGAGTARVTATVVNEDGQTLTATTDGIVVSSTQAGPTVTGVRITPDTTALPLGRTASFDLEATYSDGSVRAPGAPVSWTTTTPDVLLLTSEARGVTVRARQPGQGRFIGSTVVDGRTFSATRTLTVGAADLSSVEIRTDSTQLISGTQGTFRLFGTYSDSAVPRLVTDRTVTWSKGSASMAYGLVPSGGASQGITANAPESASIRAQVRGASGAVLEDTQAFTVGADRLVALTSIGPKAGFSTTIPLGQTIPFEVRGRFLSGQERTLGADQLVFAPAPGSAGRRVEVGPTGEVTALSQGADTVQARYAGNETVSPDTAELVVQVTEAACIDGFTAAQGATVIATTRGLCLGCAVTDSSAIIDTSTASFATLTVPAALDAGVTVQVSDATRMRTPGTRAGFLLSAPAAALLSAEIRDQSAVTTTRNGVDTVDSSASSLGGQALRVTLLGSVGGRDLFGVSVNTTTDFDGVRLDYRAATSALGQVRVHSACAAQVN